MNDLEGLRSRVETTAERLAATQNDRRHKNRSLLDILTRLEQKFAAQEQELAYYRDRIRPLEVANTQLSALMQRLLDMVDAGLGQTDEPDDPVRRATAIAEAMLERDLIPPPPAGEDAGARYDDVDAATLAAEAEAEAVFEDADDAALAAEAAADEGGPAEDLPEPVRIAMAAAASDGELPSVESLAAAIGAETGGDDPAQPTAADIRALLERVEAAAARMSATREPPIPNAIDIPVPAAPARHSSGHVAA